MAFPDNQKQSNSSAVSGMHESAVWKPSEKKLPVEKPQTPPTAKEAEDYIAKMAAHYAKDETTSTASTSQQTYQNLSTKKNKKVEKKEREIDALDKKLTIDPDLQKTFTAPQTAPAAPASTPVKSTAEIMTEMQRSEAKAKVVQSAVAYTTPAIQLSSDPDARKAHAAMQNRFKQALGAAKKNKVAIEEKQKEQKEADEKLKKINFQIDEYKDAFTPAVIQELTKKTSNGNNAELGPSKYYQHKAIFEAPIDPNDLSKGTVETVLRSKLGGKPPKTLDDLKTELSAEQIKELKDLTILSANVDELVAQWDKIKQPPAGKQYIEANVEESEALRRVGTLLNPINDAQGLKKVWDDLEIERQKADDANDKCIQDLEQLEKNQEILDTEVTDVQTDAKAATHQEEMQQLKELSQSNPTLARAIFNAKVINRKLDKLDNEQVKLQLKVNDDIAEWKKNYIDEASSSTDLGPHVEQLTAAVVDAKDHLKKLEDELKILESQLNNLNQSIEVLKKAAEEKVKERIKINGTWKDSIRPTYFSRTDDEHAEITTLTQLQKDAKKHIARIKNEMAEFRQNVENTYHKIDEKFALNQKSVLGKGAHHAGNLVGAVASSPENYLNYKKRQGGWFGSIKNQWNTDHGVKAGLDAVGTVIATATILPAVYYYFTQNQITMTPLEAEKATAADAREIKLAVGSTFGTIKKSFAENGEKSVKAELGIFLNNIYVPLTTSARRALILAFIGQCRRQGLIHYDANGKNPYINFVEVPNDQYRAELAVILGQMGIAAKGPAMVVEDDAKYAGHFKDAQKWADDKKNDYIKKNPEIFAKLDPVNDADEIHKHYLYFLETEMQGAASVNESIFQKKPGGTKTSVGLNTQKNNIQNKPKKQKPGVPTSIGLGSQNKPNNQNNNGTKTSIGSTNGNAPQSNNANGATQTKIGLNNANASQPNNANGTQTKIGANAGSGANAQPQNKTNSTPKTTIGLNGNAPVASSTSNINNTSSTTKTCFSGYGSAMAAPTGFKGHKVSGDGSCLFHSVAHQMTRATGKIYSHTKLRKEAWDWLNINHTKNDQLITPNDLKEAGCTTKEEYLEKMDPSKNPSSWAGGPELQALANVLSINITVHHPEVPTAGKKAEDCWADHTYVPIPDNSNLTPKSAVATINIKYHADHYDSLIPVTAPTTTTDPMDDFSSTFSSLGMN